MIQADIWKDTDNTNNRAFIMECTVHSGTDYFVIISPCRMHRREHRQDLGLSEGNHQQIERWREDSDHHWPTARGTDTPLYHASTTRVNNDKWISKVYSSENDNCIQQAIQLNISVAVYTWQQSSCTGMPRVSISHQCSTASSTTV